LCSIEASREQSLDMPLSGYACPRYEGVETPTWCGSNYDGRGNPRFVAPNRNSEDGGLLIPGEFNDNPMSTWQYMHSGTYNEDLLWGVPTFDNFLRSFGSVFQIITLEAWTPIMYMCGDSQGTTMATIFFMILVVLGNWFSLNLFLAVFETSFGDDDEDEDEDEDSEGPSSPKSQGKRATNRVSLAVTVARQKSAASAKKCLPSFFHDPHYKGCGYRLANSAEFGNASMAVIMLNTVVLSMDHHPMDNQMSWWLDYLSTICTLVFAGEMVFKYMALGLGGYYFGPDAQFNAFDSVIVYISMFEFIMPGEGGGATALRSFRLFRIFKLAKGWKDMRILMDKLVKTANDMGSFMVLLALFLYIMTMLGMCFFANRMMFDDNGYRVHPSDPCHLAKFHDPENPCAEVPRANFDTFVWGITTVFEVLSGENWNAVYYDTVRASSWTMGSVYFLLLIMIGDFFVMNLFLAMLLDNFSDDDEEKEQDDNANAIEGGEEQAGEGDGDAGESKSEEEKGNGSCLGKCFPSASHKHTTEDADVIDFIDIYRSNNVSYKLYNAHTFGFFDPESGIRLFCADLDNSSTFDSCILVLICVACVTLVMDNPLNEQCDSPFSSECTDFSRGLLCCNYILTAVFVAEFFIKSIAKGLVFIPGAYLLDNWNRLDFVIVMVSVASLFQGTPGLSALKSLRALRALRPLRVINRIPGIRVVVNALLNALPDTMNVLAVILIFILIFSIFAVTYLKGRFGMCMSGGPYENSVWDDMIANTTFEEFLTYPVEWAEMTDTEKSWFGPQSPFKNSSKFMDDCPSWPDEPCCNNFRGSSDQYEPWQLSVAPTSRDICECWGAYWDHALPWHFDNVLIAFGTLFEIASTEGWIDVMQQAVDSRAEIDMQPIPNHNELWILYFMLFIMMGAYLFINLFVGVVIDNFSKMKHEVDEQEGVDPEGGLGNVERKMKLEGSVLLTEEQKAWYKTQKILMKVLGSAKQEEDMMAPKDSFGKKCFRIVRNPFFDRFITACVVVNVFVMCLGGFGAKDEWLKSGNNLNTTFILIFNAEFLLKAYGLRSQYFALPKKIGRGAKTKSPHDGDDEGGEDDEEDHHSDPLTGAIKNWTIQWWNVFDFFIVMGTDLGSILMLSSEGGTAYAPIATAVRGFRVMRILKLINGHEDLKHLLATLLTTLPQLSNVLSLVVLFLFIYAMLGVQLFAKVGYRGDVNNYANFRSFEGAVILLVRFSTGENFNGYMHDLSSDHLYRWESIVDTNENGTNILEWSTCVEDPPYDPRYCGFDFVEEGTQDCVPLNGCGSKMYAYFYLLSFNVVISYVVINLFIGVVLEGFDTTDESTGLPPVSASVVIQIRGAFKKYDEDNSEFISFPDDMEDLLCDLPHPYGFAGLKRKKIKRLEFERAMKDMDLTIYKGNRVHFVDTLSGLVKRALKYQLRELGKESDIELPVATHGQMLHEIGKEVPNINLREVAAGNVGGGLTTRELMAARFIQARWKHKHRQMKFTGELSNLRLVDCMRKEDKEKTIHGEMSSPPKVEMVKFLDSLLQNENTIKKKITLRTGPDVARLSIRSSGPFAQLTKSAFDDLKSKTNESAALQGAIDEDEGDANAEGTEAVLSDRNDDDGVGEGIEGGWEEVETGGALQATASPGSSTGKLPPVKPPPGSGR